MPKFTAYSQSELIRTSSLLAAGLLHAGLTAGDRVGNLFYAGDLYGSFLLHILSVIALPVPAVQIPIGGHMPPETTAQLLTVCRVTAVLSTPSSLIRLANYCKLNGCVFDLVSAVMVSGEAMFADQVLDLKAIFPNATMRSCAYGSIDAGMVAVSAAKEDPREHRFIAEAVAMEIVEEDTDSQVVICNNGVPGRVIVTNLIRDLTPIIRYPTGDRAEWVDKDAGIFRLLGRSNQAVRLGPVSLDMAHLRQIAQTVLASTRITGFQVILNRQNQKDQMQVSIATNTEPAVDAGDAILRQLERERPMFQQHVENSMIAPATVVFMPISAMKMRNHSGKTPEVVDLRFE